MDRPTVLFYCQHSLGLGHLVRSRAVANGLAERFRVVFLNGGAMPGGFGWPRAVERIDLPPLGMDAGAKLVSLDGRHTVEEALRIRQEIMTRTLRTIRPSALLIEMFPFGRKKFAPELLPLLEAAHELSEDRPVVLCSLRDILIGNRRDQRRHDERASTLANRYFDGVLVHADPRFARLDESFQPETPLRIPVHYTGFVRTESTPTPVDIRSRNHETIVSAGGGAVGEPLFRAALEAHRLVWPRRRVPMKIVAGPFLPAQAWQSLLDLADGIDGVSLIRSVPDLGREIGAAAASVSQCGYNTALDLLRAGTPSLVVPFSDGQETEQMDRARRLERLGAVRVIDAESLDGPTLARELEGLLEFTPVPVALADEGQRETARLVARLVRDRESRALAAVGDRS